jgi:hypothetical protein
MSVAVSFRISGKVQGVYFRKHTVSFARSLEVSCCQPCKCVCHDLFSYEKLLMFAFLQ